MKSGIILVGEPMGLLIAQEEGALDSVTGYSLAVAGAEFNVAVGLSRLGQKATYLTKLGQDPFGKRIVQVLSDNKIGTEFITYSKEQTTGFMLKGRTSVGDPEIFYYRKGSAASTLSKEDVDQIDFSSYSYLHMTGILPALSESTREASSYLMEKAREHGLLICFDPNLRPQLWNDQEKMIQVINELASKADVVFPGVAEGKILMGSDDPKKINEFFIKNGAKTVVTKCGGSGAFVTSGEKEFMSPGFDVDKVIDTVGAGDGFAAGTINGLMEGLSIEEAVQMGNAVGAIQVTSRGDNEGLPTTEELNTFIKKGGK